jgi:hypothetical protein
MLMKHILCSEFEMLLCIVGSKFSQFARPNKKLVCSPWWIILVFRSVCQRRVTHIYFQTLFNDTVSNTLSLMMDLSGNDESNVV